MTTSTYWEMSYNLAGGIEGVGEKKGNKQIYFQMTTVMSEFSQGIPNSSLWLFLPPTFLLPVTSPILRMAIHLQSLEQYLRYSKCSVSLC